MRTFRFFMTVFALFAFILAACEKDPIEERIGRDDMIINNDLSRLSRRVKIIEDGRVMPVLPVDHTATAGALKSAPVQTKYEIILRAEVAPPSYEGKTLQASHIRIVGNNAFVTYNYQGDEYLGGVDVFDVSNIDNPVLTQNVIFPEKDISSIDVEPLGIGMNNFIYLAGAYNLDFDTLGLASPAVVERFNANANNEFVGMEDPRQFADLPSYAGNDVRFDHSGNMAVYATSGSKGGGLTILNHGMQQPRFISIPYARSIDIEGDKMVVYSAENSMLHVIDINDLSPDAGENEYVDADPFLIPTGGEHFKDMDDEDSYLEAKSIVRLKGNLAFVAAGTGGMEIYDITNGEKVGYLPRPAEYNDADTPLDYVTNGVSVNDNLILAAKGGSGVHIAELEDEGSDNRARSIGKFKFEEGSSANFVEARDNKVFVATGLGGLKILEIVELEPTELCETLWDDIVALLPERESIHKEGHPAHNLYGEDLPGTIKLNADAPVYITFVHNGAGWDNSFGYYAYHKDDPPDSAGDIDKNIVYAYVNENTNGQEREQGERIRLGGEAKIFDEGTVIGFFIVARGWDKDAGRKVDGKHTLYTDTEFNPGGQRKHILFLEDSCDDIVLGFEDMLDEDDSDEDFNDIILVISNGDDVFGNQTNQYINTPGLPRPENR